MTDIKGICCSVTFHTKWTHQPGTYLPLWSLPHISTPEAPAVFQPHCPSLGGLEKSHLYLRPQVGKSQSLLLIPRPPYTQLAGPPNPLFQTYLPPGKLFTFASAATSFRQATCLRTLTVNTPSTITAAHKKLLQLALTTSCLLPSSPPPLSPTTDSAFALKKLQDITPRALLVLF